MQLKYFYDQALAHASYMVGCQRAKVAIVVDPGRDIEQYISTAAKEGLTIAAVAETHIHADYVSGARELADRVNAKLYVSDEGPAEWKYLYLDQYDHQLLHDGDDFTVGNIRFEVLHTPGHTPESISFLLTDQGGGADQPMGIFTGDFVFVGSIGRPDLLEEAAGLANTAEPGARDLFHSAEKFKKLPDYLQVWPAHGAGSACGKGLGAIPSSTVGYEKLYNPALQFTNEDEFVEYILRDQPEAPKYFAVMKRVNKEGPNLLGTNNSPPKLSSEKLSEALRVGTVVDTRPPEQFAKAHVAKTINIPATMLASWAGWLVDYERPVFLISDAADTGEAERVLRKIGVEDLQGYFDAQDILQTGMAHQQYDSQPPNELEAKVAQGTVTLIDVRSDEEWKAGRIAGAHHKFLGRLPGQVDSLPDDKPILLQCQSGGRSAIATSLLQAAGKQVINLSGGLNRWIAEGLPVEGHQEADCDTAAQCALPK